MYKLLAALGILVSCLIPWTGTQATEQTSEHILRIGLSEAPNSLDPIHGNLEIANSLFDQIFINLRDRDRLDQWSILDSWVASEDGLRYTLHIRRDLIWSDNSPVIADDIVATLRYFLSEKGRAPIKSQYQAILMEKSKTPGQPDEPSIDLIDQFSFSIDLSKPDPLFVERLMASSIITLKASQLKTHGDDWHKPENLLTLSPYRIENNDLPNSLSLRKIKNFPGADRLHWDKVEFSFIPDIKKRIRDLQDNKLDAIRINEVNSAVDNSLGLPGKILLSSNPNSRFIILNPKSEKLESPELREAIKLLADPYTLTHGSSALEKPLYSIIPPDLDPDYPVKAKPNLGLNERLAQAEKLLRSIGITYENPTHLTFRVLNQRPNRLSAERLAAMSKNYGLILDIKTSDSKEHYAQLFKGNYEIFGMEWFLGSSLVTQQFLPFRKDGAAIPLHDKKYLTLLDEMSNAKTKIDLYQHLREAEDHLTKSHYVLPISMFFHAYMVGPNIDLNQKATGRMWLLKPAEPNTTGTIK